MPRRRTPPAVPLTPARVAGEPIDWRDQLLTFLTLVVILLAFIRCLVPLTVNLYWEDDPRRSYAAGAHDSSGAAPAAPIDIEPQFLGPVGASVLDAVSVAAAGAALLAHVIAGGALRWPSLLLGGIGMIVCAVHAREHIENAFVCGAWLGGIALALAALHLASRPRQRRWFIAALIALAAPLAVEATRYVFVDHADSLAFFKENEEAWLKARGWEKGSPEHLMYVRRMEFGEPTGAFTFSNILGSVAAMIAAVSAAVAIGLWRHRARLPHRWWLAGAVAAVAAWTLLLTHSKGAPVALMMAGAVVLLALMLRRHALLKRVLPAAALLMIIAAVALVIVRGMIGPPQDAEGERSILFRWHYWQAAARIASASPQNALLGVGPAQFNDDYAWAKNPINPEEVKSAHSVFVDLIANLGVAGWLLTALLIAWLIAAARSAAADIRDDPAPSPHETDKPMKALEVAGPDLAWTILFLAALFGMEMLVRGESYATPERFLSWSIGMMFAFFLLAVFVSPHWLPRGFDRLALFAGALVLLVHAQIEMTFFQPSSAPLAWLILGAAATREHTTGTVTPGEPSGHSTASPAPRTALVSRLFPGAALVIAAVVYVFALVAPVVHQQHQLRDAAKTLRLDSPPAVLNAMRTLNAAMHPPHNPKAYEWHARLAIEVAAGVRASLVGTPPERVSPEAKRVIKSYADGAIETLESAEAAGLDSVALKRQRAQFLAIAAGFVDDGRYRERSAAAWREVIALRPYAWQDRVEFADVLWKLGRVDEAQTEYRQAIELSDAMYLEPTRMMAPLERRRIERRLTGDETPSS